MVKVDVDLVTVGCVGFAKEDCPRRRRPKGNRLSILEDGTKQKITNFSQDSLPLSVLLLIDRGGCIDPFGNEVHRASNEALARLKETDEVAVMTYHDNAELLQGFTRDRSQIARRVGTNSKSRHLGRSLLEQGFSKAADYMVTPVIR